MQFRFRFQWIDVGIFLALATALVAFVFCRVKRVGTIEEGLQRRVAQSACEQRMILNQWVEVVVW